MKSATIMSLRSIISCFFLSVSLCYACSSTQSVASTSSIEKKVPVPVMTFEQAIKDLGTMKEGDKQELAYHFTNTGDAPLIIELATTCKCTDITWPTEPIPPGGKGVIEAIFDSSGFNGPISKSIDIIANTDPIVVEAKFVVDVVSSED